MLALLTNHAELRPGARCPHELIEEALALSAVILAFDRTQEYRYWLRALHAGGRICSGSRGIGLR